MQLISLILALLLSACGGSSRNSNESSVITKNSLRGFEPIIYPYSNLYEETSTANFGEQGSFEAFTLGAQGNSSYPVSLQSFPNRPGLGNQIVQNVYTNGVFQLKASVTRYIDRNSGAITYETKPEVDKVNDSFTIANYSAIHLPLLLRLKEGTPYAEETAESEAISLLPIFEKSFQFAHSALGRLPNPFTLIINTDFQEKITAAIRDDRDDILYANLHVTEHETANAFWTYKGPDSSAAIVFLPQPNPNKPQDQKASQLVNYARQIPTLWKIPFVAAHEYGHHILSSHMYESVDPDDRLKVFASKDSYRSCLNHPSQLVEGMRETQNEKARRFFWVIFESYSEGFADVFAHLALDGVYSDLSFDQCFIGGANRTITTPRFGNGDIKKFSKSTMSAMFPDKPKMKNEGSQNPCDPEYLDYRDSHMTGAIIAYITNKLFEKTGIDKQNALKYLEELSKKIVSDLSNQLDSGSEKNLKSNAQETFLQTVKFQLELFLKRFPQAQTPENCSFLKHSFDDYSIKSYLDKSYCIPLPTSESLETN